MKSLSKVFGLCLAVVSWQAFGFMSSQAPSRANDLAYGGILYEYHQGNAFEALSLLKVATEKGGINGHGEHPDLVEGGLLLSYGLTHEAKNIFEDLLKKKLSIADRNLAWFYLGKVFYLEENYTESIDSFNNIILRRLANQDREKFYEIIYLVSQIESQVESQIKTQAKTDAQSKAFNQQTRNISLLRRLGVSVNVLPKNHIYSYYIRYNEAVSLVSDSKPALAIESFESLVNRLSLEKSEGQWRDTPLNKQSPNRASNTISLASELKALFNQSLLSLGQLYLQQDQNERAFNVLKQVDKTSAFSDKALFAFAISASNLERYDRALAALNELNEQTLFNPWQQQTPYALAYLYEKLNEPVLALEAYRAAVAKYEALQMSLNKERSELSENVLLDVLNIKSAIGSVALAKDAYGRLEPLPTRFSFSRLLSSEQFQRQLSELHELYLIKNSMHRWEAQLNSFQDSLETRLLSRQQKLAATRTNLETKEVDSWNSKAQAFQNAIHSAIDNNDAYFFMTDAQIAYFNRIQTAQERLASLPNNHPKKAAYAQRFKRAKAYFDWWVHDDFSVNRWLAEKQLKALQGEMGLFRKQYTLLASEKKLDDAHLEFVARVSSGKQRLAVLKTALNNSLSESSTQLLSLVDNAMQQQGLEIGRYLLASREALARVSDKLLVEGKIRYVQQEGALPATQLDSVKADKEISLPPSHKTEEAQ